MSADVDATTGDPPPTRAVIAFGPAVATWAIAWVVGSVVLAPIVIVALGADLGADPGDDLTIPQLFAVAVVGWAAFLVALAVASRRFGSGDPLADFGWHFRPIDLVGVPIGVATQKVLVPLVYTPLRAIWPETFSSERVEERAQDLADRAGGGLTVLLVVIVVIGAPIVEELVYRGLIQRSASALIGAWPGLVLTSLWFAIIHFSPVEYPGLFVVGLVFGVCVTVTNRIGPAIVTHAAFNAVGIITVLSST